MLLLQRILWPLLVSVVASSDCDAPSPAFLLPKLHHNSAALNKTTSRVTSHLRGIISDAKYSRSHVSIEVTSQEVSLFDFFHTARERSTVHRGADAIKNDTNYRIASMTKPFTVLALLQLAQDGALRLDDSILRYIPQLDHEDGKGSNGLPWKDMTIRSLATQNSGLPRDLAQGDIAIDPEMAAEFGLPDLSSIHDIKLPECDSMVDYTRACNATDLLDWVDQLPPVYAPHQKSTYSNINFDLLGLVVANASGMSFEKYVQKHILDPVGMKGTGFSTPKDEFAAIPKDEERYWTFEIDVQNPTGGLYSNAGDMGRWIRHCLSIYNSVGLNWFDPTSWSGSRDTFYGMPWEIFRARTSDILVQTTSRPITLVTKGGGLPGYSSVTIIVPEYGFGAVILVAGEPDLVQQIAEVIVKEFVQLAEEVAMDELKKYTGVYTGEASDKVVLGMDQNGLVVEEFLSRGKDVRAKLTASGDTEEKIVLQVVPTLLFADEKKQMGERWRMLMYSNSLSKQSSILDNYCVTNIEGLGSFAGKALNELVFWNRDGGIELELSAFRKTLKKQKAGASREDNSQKSLEL